MHSFENKSFFFKFFKLQLRIDDYTGKTLGRQLSEVGAVIHWVGQVACLLLHGIIFIVYIVTGKIVRF